MKIVWTGFAIKNVKSIYLYYCEKANIKVANKIKTQIQNAPKKLLYNPEIGQVELNLVEDKLEYRYLVVNNYKIIYRIDEKQIIINDVFDTRQNPIKMNDKERL